MYYLVKNGNEYSLNMSKIDLFNGDNTGDYPCSSLSSSTSIEEYPEKTGYVSNYKDIYAKIFLNGLIFSLSGKYKKPGTAEWHDPTRPPYTPPVIVISNESLEITLKIENTSNVDIIINKLFCDIPKNNFNHENDLKYYQDENRTKSCENLRLPANSSITCYCIPPANTATSPATIPAITYNTGITNSDGTPVINTESTGNRTKIIFTTQNSVLSKQQITLSFSNVNSSEDSRPKENTRWTKDPLTYIYKVDDSDSKKVYYEEKK